MGFSRDLTRSFKRQRERARAEDEKLIDQLMNPTPMSVRTLSPRKKSDGERGKKRRERGKRGEERGEREKRREAREERKEKGKLRLRCSFQ